MSMCSSSSSRLARVLCYLWSLVCFKVVCGWFLLLSYAIQSIVSTQATAPHLISSIEWFVHYEWRKRTRMDNTIVSCMVYGAKMSVRVLVCLTFGICVQCSLFIHNERIGYMLFKYTQIFTNMWMYNVINYTIQNNNGNYLSNLLKDLYI